MARSILRLGTLTAFASSIAFRKRILVSTSPPPILAATMMALLSLLQSFPRLLSTAAFLWAMFAQCECPAMEILKGMGGD